MVKPTNAAGSKRTANLLNAGCFKGKGKFGDADYHAHVGSAEGEEDMNKRMTALTIWLHGIGAFSFIATQSFPDVANETTVEFRPRTDVTQRVTFKVC